MVGWLFGAIGKTILTTLGSIVGSQASVEQAKARRDAEIGAALAGTASVEAQARAAERQSYASAGYWWAVLMLLLPAFIASMAASLHFFAAALDSAFSFPWTVHALPGPMAEWQGVILTTIVGGGGLAGLAMMFGRR